MIFEVWDDREVHGEIAMFPRDSAENRALLSPSAKLLHTFEADGWEEAMTKYHELMQWEPYKPLDD